VRQLSAVEVTHPDVLDNLARPAQTREFRHSTPQILAYMENPHRDNT
jgi:hypothetical protein